MTSSQSNPFILPGMGQAADMAGNPLLASMEMMRQAWAALAGPGGLAQAMSMTPPMSPEDLERRITELRSVENWLRMNLSMLSSTIQGLEVQRATIATLRSFVDSAAAAQGSPGASPWDIVLGLKPATRTGQAPREAGKSTPGGAGGSASPAGSAAAGDAARPERSAAAGGSAGTAGAAGPAQSSAQEAAGGPAAGAEAGWSQASQSASQAWWNLLQQQFGQLAAAAAATMPEMPAAESPPAGGSATPAKKRAPRKRAASRPATGGKASSGKSSSE